MKLICKKISNPLDLSFNAIRSTQPCHDEQLHFHEELELILVVRGSGMKLIGENMMNFGPGDLALIGSNLPHLWRNHAETRPEEAEVIVIQFRADFLGHDFFNHSEMRKITQLMQKSKAGLNITGRTHKEVKKRMERIVETASFERVLLLLEILHIMSDSKEVEYLSSLHEHEQYQRVENARMDRVYKYMIDHFRDDIALDEIASVACLSTSAFCKYFKKRTRKTFSTFLNEMKIGHACKLLIDGDYSVSEVCFESGFQSLTNFNRQFKSITRFSPQEYKKKYQVVIGVAAYTPIMQTA